MLVKNVIFFTTLWLFIGCGVMNNPKQETPNTAHDGDAAIAGGELKNALVGSVYHFTLDEAYPSYKILTSPNEQTILFPELNVTIDYPQNNLLAYPITMQEGCAIHESIITDANHSTITIQADETNCTQTPTNYLLFYNIAKTIETIMIDKFDEENVTILNSKKL